MERDKGIFFTKGRRIFGGTSCFFFKVYGTWRLHMRQNNCT